ncbi:MAG: OsmC family protein [Chitinophagales bacterium]
MQSEELKSIQQPLKEQYKSDPESAVVTLHASARLGEGITCSVETGKALVTAGLHPATGGTGMAACSGDMLLEALAACAGVTMNAVATSIAFQLEDAIIYAEGDLDFRGTLGVSKEALVGFKNIRLRFVLQTNESEERKATLIKLTERYCVVLQTLKNMPEITSEIA